MLIGIDCYKATTCSVVRYKHILDEVEYFSSDALTAIFPGNTQTANFNRRIITSVLGAWKLLFYLSPSRFIFGVLCYFVIGQAKKAMVSSSFSITYVTESNLLRYSNDAL